MVEIGRITALDRFHGGLGQCGLHIHHYLSVGGGLLRAITHQTESLLQVRDVLSAKLDRFRIVPEIVVAVGQPQPSLVDDGDHLGGVIEILARSESEYGGVKARGTLAGYCERNPVQASQRFRQLRLVSQALDALELRRDGRDPFAVDRLFVDASIAAIANRLFDRTAIWIARGLL